MIFLPIRTYLLRFILLLLLINGWMGCTDNTNPVSTKTVEEKDLPPLEDLTVVEILEKMQKHFSTQIDTIHNYSLLTDEDLNIFVRKVVKEDGKPIFEARTTNKLVPGRQRQLWVGNQYEIWNRAGFAAIDDFEKIATAMKYIGTDIVDGARTYVVEVDRNKLNELGEEGQSLFDDPDTSGGAVVELYIDPSNWMVRQIQGKVNNGTAVVTVKWQGFVKFGGLDFGKQRSVVMEGEGIGLTPEQRKLVEQNLVSMKEQLMQIESNPSGVGAENYTQITNTLRQDIARTEKQLLNMEEGKITEYVALQEIAVNKGVPEQLFGEGE